MGLRQGPMRSAFAGDSERWLSPARSAIAAPNSVLRHLAELCRCIDAGGRSLRDHHRRERIRRPRQRPYAD